MPDERRRATDKGELEVSLIIPSLNEEDNVWITLEALDELRVRHDLGSLEALVLDDASSDRTYQRAADCVHRYPDLNIRVFRRPEPRRGYGAILRFGIAHAKGTYCIPVAADGVDPIEVIPTFLERVRDGADLVQCSRYAEGGDTTTIPFKYRFFQAIWRFLVRVLLGMNVKDSTYSFKIFRRVDVLSIGLTSNGFSISPEIFFKAMLSGKSVAFVPAGQGSRRKGSSKFVFHREGFGFFYVLLRAALHRIGILWF